MLMVFFVALSLALLVYKVQGPSFTDKSRLMAIDADLSPVVLDRPVSYEQQVKPILERRCVVCHGCYDAPCQLKLSSAEGLRRGASDELVYNPSRLEAAQPTRLFVDARTTEEWRSLGFHPVLNEGRQTAEQNLKNSPLYHMLHLKQQHPQPDSKRLPDRFTLGLDREQTCPTLKTVDKFAREHPLWGMPYAMPNLSEKRFEAWRQ